MSLALQSSDEVPVAFLTYLRALPGSSNQRGRKQGTFMPFQTDGGTRAVPATHAAEIVGSLEPRNPKPG